MGLEYATTNPLISIHPISRIPNPPSQKGTGFSSLLTRAARRQSSKVALADDARVGVAADDGAHAEAGAVSGDIRCRSGRGAVVAAVRLVDAEGDGIEALLDGGAADGGGEEEGGDGELHVDGCGKKLGALEWELGVWW